jgi:hypothetical protein
MLKIVVTTKPLKQTKPSDAKHWEAAEHGAL